MGLLTDVDPSFGAGLSGGFHIGGDEEEEEEDDAAEPADVEVVYSLPHTLLHVFVTNQAALTLCSITRSRCELWGTLVHVAGILPMD